MHLRPALRGASFSLMVHAWFFSHWVADPCFNMAFDEWMLSWVVTHPGAVILRLYTWREGTITFGCNQKQETALDFSRLNGTPVIRRITGGRAVYHDTGELTYSIAVNPSVPELANLSGSIATVHRLLAEALQEFLARLGIATAITDRSSSRDAHPEFFHKAPCFASHARHELICGDRKIVASAQRRSGDGLLQHGSIKLGGRAPHQALGDDVQTTCAPPQALEKKQLDLLSPIFTSALADVLGVTIEICPCEEAVAAAVGDRCQTVARNALDRRDILCTDAMSKQSIT
jgi:lipoate-protein ligase A